MPAWRSQGPPAAAPGLSPGWTACSNDTGYWGSPTRSCASTPTTLEGARGGAHHVLRLPQHLPGPAARGGDRVMGALNHFAAVPFRKRAGPVSRCAAVHHAGLWPRAIDKTRPRSEERRVGKECRYEGKQDKKKK